MNEQQLLDELAEVRESILTLQDELLETDQDLIDLVTKLQERIGVSKPKPKSKGPPAICIARSPSDAGASEKERCESCAQSEQRTPA